MKKAWVLILLTAAALIVTLVLIVAVEWRSLDSVAPAQPPSAPAAG